MGNESIISYHKNEKTNHPAGIEKFKNRFQVFAYEDFSEVDAIIKKNQVDLFYAIKNGDKDGIETKECKTAIHSVFKHYEPHGDVYAYVSEWLALEMTAGKSPFVPHMVNFQEEIHDDLRTELGIPKTAKVLGYYGGAQSFNIQFVRTEVEKLARKYKDLYFIFMGVDSFVAKKWWKSDVKNIIFLPPSSDLLYKLKFINTCDALLHARERGETFGITVAEFAIKGKPVITFADSPEKNHIHELKENAYYYHNAKDLKEILLENNLTKTATENYQKFLPEAVMEKFKEVFII